MAHHRKSPLIPAQIRAGRALIGWSQQQLAEAAALSLSSIRDYESERRGGIVGGLQAIRTALENQGVIFLAGDNTDGPGVRLAAEKPNVLRRPTRLDNDGLVIPVEWRGRAIDVFVPREILEDLGQVPGEKTLSDAQYAALFDQYRAVILEAASGAIDGGRVTSDKRVHLTYDDIPGLSP